MVRVIYVVHVVVVVKNSRIVIEHIQGIVFKEDVEKFWNKSIGHWVVKSNSVTFPSSCPNE